MTTVVLAGNNVGGLVQGNYGTYIQASDGTFTVDTRDAAAMLSMGMSYVNKGGKYYHTPAAPAAASATVFVASATLSNGALTIAAQPDVMRQGQIVIGQLASPGPSGGTLSLTYYANDGTLQTDTVPLSRGNVAAYTTQTSKGVMQITTGSVSGLAGSGYVTIGSTAAISVPIDQGSDCTFLSEIDDTTNETVGTKSTVTKGTITPTTAPNGTHTYSFGYVPS